MNCGAQLAIARELTGRAAPDLILGYVRNCVPNATVLQNLAAAKLKDTQDIISGAFHIAIA